MNGKEVRKNYGGRMIFGDEKLTPLRSVPRCALGFASGRLTGGYAVRGSARPSPKLLPSVATSRTRQPLDESRQYRQHYLFITFNGLISE